MTKDEIKDSVISRISYQAYTSDITLESLLESDLLLDDLDIVECQIDLEKAFDITIPDDKWYEVKTVGDAVNLVTEILEQQNN